MKDKFYITTAIAYASKKPHVGNDYEIILTDSIARYNREMGKDVFMLTGTDEHGQKIEELAKESSTTPSEYAKKVSDMIENNYKAINISNDGFIRTTDKIHEKVVAQIFKKLYDKGDIYKSNYEGWYCKPCESFWTKTQLGSGECCPDCGRPVSKTKEEAYFFAMSKYSDRLLKHMEEHDDFILPQQRKKEMINNFIKPGLQDLCVSRTSFDWGVKVDFDPKHVVYVWLDALVNYISAIGYDINKPSAQFKKLWPCDLHVVGKDIVRFHTIYWPIFLMALDLPLPKTVLGHPWLLFANDKMSKSKGNVLYSEKLASDFSLDGLRYFVLSQMPYDKDGNITKELLVSTYNSDLANTLGNLVSRTIAMCNKYFDGQITKPEIDCDISKAFTAEISALQNLVESKMKKYMVADAICEIITFTRKANKYIDDTMPWVLAKDEANKERLNGVLYNLLEAIRVISVHLRAFMPDTAESILSQIGASKHDYKSASKYDDGIKFAIVKNAVPLFARIDEKEYLKEDGVGQEQQGKQLKQENKQVNADNQNGKHASGDSQISIDDFAKVKLKVAKVLTCEKVEGSEKLLKMTLKVGEQTKTVVSGIAKHYRENDMVGRKVVFVSNLKPAKLKGIESQGMILCASSKDDNDVVLLSVEKDIDDGCDIF